MRLKPKSTVHNDRAILFRRYTDLEQSFGKRVLYRTRDGKLWLFSSESQNFVEYTGETSGFSQIINAYSETDVTKFKIFQFRSSYFWYIDGIQDENGGWIVSSTLPYSSTDVTINGTSDNQNNLEISYEVPENYIMALGETLEISIDKDDIRCEATIYATNALGETAEYYFSGDIEVGQTSFIATLTGTRENAGFGKNTIVANFHFERGA